MQYKESRGKQLFNTYIVDALSAMAMGVFASLIIGVIFAQFYAISKFETFNIIASVLGASSPVIGGTIGLAIAHKLRISNFTLYCASVAGAIGYKYAGPLGAYIAAIVAIEVGKRVVGKTNFDILLVPFSTLLAAGLIIQITYPVLNDGINALQNFLSRATLLLPIPMGIVISLVFGLALTAPISSAAIAAVVFAGVQGEVSDGLLLAAGAATTGCCCQMIGFATASYRENGMSGFIVQGIGTSMVQFGNIMKSPVIWLPPSICSCILGPLSTTIFSMKNISAAAGMGTSGLVGQIGTLNVMASEGVAGVLIKMLVLHIVLPIIVTLAISELFRKLGWIKYGDMKLELK